MASLEKDWIRVEWVGAVAIPQLTEQLKAGALSGQYHYLLFPDGTVRADRALERGTIIALLAVRDGEEASERQLERITVLRDYIAAWNDPDPGTDIAAPDWVEGAKGALMRGAPETGSREGPALDGLARDGGAPRFPALIDPGPFTGDATQLRELALHVINLRKGTLSADGIMTTDERDLDEIVAAIVEKAQQGFKLMLYAHGGLTDERSGLASAWAYHRWWLAHGIYPVYFVWETGGLEIFWQIVQGTRRGGRAISRDIWDYTADPAVELIGGKVGTLLWTAMKESARLSSEAKGGARLFAEKLAKVWKQPTDIFAIGHSAGSIFHAYFLPVLCRGKLEVKQLHLLAPAITNALFTEKLAPLFGSKIKGGTLFAMTREAERADNCANVYHKSLLYLVSRAFEPQKETPILGMEDFHRSDPSVGRLFGSGRILSPTPAASKPTLASGSRSHGGFDNDVATIENILRRMLGLGDTGVVRPAFPPGEPRIGRATVEPNYYGMPAGLFDGAPAFDKVSPAFAPATGSGAGSVAAPMPPQSIGVGGQRIALCIGNDSFPDSMRLYGCINDAKTWAETFRLQGYQPTLLTDANAGQIRDTIRGILAKARSGDSVMIHISSHGSRVLDVDGDELQDKMYADTKDEALVALDWRDGGLIIDDEWPGLMTVAKGVKVIRFHDFCHSGRSSRMALGGRPDRRRRSVSLPDDIARKAYAATAATRTRGAAGATLYGAELDYVTFCACLPDQSAMEEAGSGVFTRAATKILRGQGSAMTAQDVFAAIEREMAGEEQKPLIEGSALYSAASLFALPA